MMITLSRLSERVRKRLERQQAEEDLIRLHEYVKEREKLNKEDKTWHLRIDTLVFGFVIVFIIWAAIVTAPTYP